MALNIRGSTIKGTIEFRVHCISIVAITIKLISQTIVLLVYTIRSVLFRKFELQRFTTTNDIIRAFTPLNGDAYLEEDC